MNCHICNSSIKLLRDCIVLDNVIYVLCEDWQCWNTLRHVRHEEFRRSYNKGRVLFSLTGQETRIDD